MYKQEILTVFIKCHLIAFINLMGIGYNLALSRLPEYLFKLNNRKALRCYYVFKNISRSNTWKLVNITYKYKSCSNCYCFKKRIHNININH